MIMAKKQNPNQYYINAGKLIKYPLDLENKTILVPSDELYEAKENLTVQHLCNSEHRFHIQSVIPGSIQLNKAEMQVKFTQRKEFVKDTGMIGKEFKIVSDGAILQIVGQESKDNFDLAYKNRPKPNFKASMGQIQKSVDIGVWKEVRQ